MIAVCSCQTHPFSRPFPPFRSRAPVLNVHSLFYLLPRPIEETKEGLSAKRAAREGKKGNRRRERPVAQVLVDVSACAPTVQSTGRKTRSTPPSLVHTPLLVHVPKSQPRRQGQPEGKKRKAREEKRPGGRRVKPTWAGSQVAFYCQVLQHGTPEQEAPDCRW